MSTKRLQDLAIATLVGLLSVPAVWTPAMAGEVSPGLHKVLAAAEAEAAGAEVAVPVIISYRSESDPFALRKRLRTEERRFRRSAVPRTLQGENRDTGRDLRAMVESIGGRNVRDLWIASSVSAELTPAMIAEVLQRPDVLQVRQDAMTESPFPMAGAPAAPEWNISLVGAPELWNLGYLGGSVVVATLDTGADALHPELAPSYRGGDNSWYDPYGEHATPYDRTGHGTQVLGLIVAGEGSGASLGVAPQARWIAAKIYDDSGNGSVSAVHAAFQWLLDPDGDPLTDDAPDVVNSSWGITDAGVCNTEFLPDIEALKAADIAVVFSVGNSGPLPTTGESPGNNPGVLSVGAVDDLSEVAAFSSRGPSSCDDALMPRLVAPGDSVQTTDLSLGGMSNYVTVSGTSFAAPHVAGVLALLRDAVPPASVEELESVLIASAVDIGIPGPDQDSGYGIVDALAALNLMSYPVDVDGDGFSASLDCNDTNATIFPGAPERIRDGVDQDCNGYDLTIKVYQAVFSHDGGSLRLRVKSGYGDRAALEVVGVGPLVYRERYKDWYLNGGSVDGYAIPVITVRGIEGDLAVTPRKPLPRR
ncbi:MAG: S8 family serine peptidase [Gammaproteobacteria bacterium]|nr:S8 family serine peptidase [Gammaproteobacteria bacterium]